MKKSETEKLRNRLYMREYNKRPDVLARAKARRADPDKRAAANAYAREYRLRQNAKETRKSYELRPEVIAKRRESDRKRKNTESARAARRARYAANEVIREKSRARAAAVYGTAEGRKRVLERNARPDIYAKKKLKLRGEIWPEVVEAFELYRQLRRQSNG